MSGITAESASGFSNLRLGGFFCLGDFFRSSQRGNFSAPDVGVLMAGARETITILQKLLHPNSAGVAHIKAIQLACLCQAYGLTGITTQWISRTLEKNKINNDTDKALRPILLRLEDLIERAAPFKISFEDVEVTKLVLNLIGFGVDVRVGEPFSVSVNSSASSKTVPAAQ